LFEFDYHPPDVPLRVIHQDDQVIVADKPAGLLSVPGKLEGRKDCLESRLRAAYWDALLVHRLDCDTSGVMIFARTKMAQGFLGQEFEQRRAKKEYVALVAGLVAEDHGRVDLPIGSDWEFRPRQKVDYVNGRSAITDWMVMARDGNRTRIRLFPQTGRSHQLRLHMREIGHPILGDPIYSQDANDFPRLMLHAEVLGLHHPATKAWVEYRAECPF
jgi:tRNA pseudouridine32 synthase / 23S rRNA pseudouridine746 synthase